MDAREIKRLRLALELTQEAFARRVEVSTSSVHRWETGETSPQGALVRRRLAQLVREAARTNP